LPINAIDSLAFNVTLMLCNSVRSPGKDFEAFRTSRIVSALAMEYGRRRDFHDVAFLQPVSDNDLHTVCGPKFDAAILNRFAILYVYEP
jgi:hypothetical protein